MADEAGEVLARNRRERRRRRANVAGGRQHRHEVKVTPEEEGRLLRLAEQQRVSIPRLLVEAALAEQPGETRTQRWDVIAALFGLHRLLGTIANNVNQMTKALHGTGQLPPQTGEVLNAVRRTAERIDEAIDRLST